MLYGSAEGDPRPQKRQRSSSKSMHSIKHEEMAIVPILNYSRSEGWNRPSEQEAMYMSPFRKWADQVRKYLLDKRVCFIPPVRLFLALSFNIFVFDANPKDANPKSHAGIINKDFKTWSSGQKSHEWLMPVEDVRTF